MKLITIRVTPKVSGAEIYNKYLLKEIIKVEEIDVQVLTNNDQFIKILHSNSIPYKKINPLIGEIGTKKQLMYAACLAAPYIIRYIKTIHSCSERGSQNVILMQSMTEKLFLTWLLKYLGYKVLWLEHGPIFITSRSVIIKYFYKISSIFVEKIIAVSKDTKNDLVEGGVSRKKIEVIYIGLDTELYKNNFKKTKYKGYSIGFIGTVGREKGILKFLEVAGSIIENEKNITFYVVGDGPLLDLSKRIVQRKNIDKFFTFTGYVENVDQYLKRIDILFLPTDHYEGISLAILESIAAGVIVYTHDIGGNKEIISNKKTGFLYKNYNKEKISNDILSILQDKTARSKIVSESEELVRRNFNIKKNSHEFAYLFQKL